jgi:nucleoside phosphorylase
MENVKKYDDEEEQFIVPIIDQYNLLLVTTTKIEKEILHSYLKPINGRSNLIKIHKGKQTYFLGILGNYNVVHVSCDKMGAISPQASITTTMNAISFCEPTVVVMVGIAFGVGGKQKIGDILVSESVVPYDIQKLGAKGPQNRGITALACTTLLNRVNNVTDWHYINGRGSPKIIPGLLLSGEKLIDNLEDKNKLLDMYPNAKGGEMEGYGVHTACSDKGIAHWIIIKGICDFADGKKSKGKERKQKIAANASVNLCQHIFNSRHAFKDLALVPIPIQVESLDQNGKDILVTPSINEVESEILIEMNIEVNSEEQSSVTTVQEIVRSFLLLDDEEKITIAKRIGVFDEKLNQMYAHIRDKEIFVRTKEKRALAEMWEAINSFSPFTKSVNPFKNVKIQ